jgi:hypothetical protein
MLINLDIDPSESHDVSRNHPDVVAELLAEVDRHRSSFEPTPSLLDVDAPASRAAR